MVVGVAWKKNDEDENVDGEMLKMDVKVMDKEYRDQLEAAASERETVPRRVAIGKQDLETFGFSVNCPGCKAVLKRDHKTETQ